MWPAGPSDFELHQVGAALPHLAHLGRAVVLDPGVRAAERMLEARQVRLPGADLEVEVVLTIALAGACSSRRRPAAGQHPAHQGAAGDAAQCARQLNARPCHARHYAGSGACHPRAGDGLFDGATWAHASAGHSDSPPLRNRSGALTQLGRCQRVEQPPRKLRALARLLVLEVDEHVAAVGGAGADGAAPSVTGPRGV